MFRFFTQPRPHVLTSVSHSALSFSSSEARAIPWGKHAYEVACYHPRVWIGYAAAGVMLLQVKIGFAAAGEDWLCCRVATIFSGGLAVSLPAPITHFFRRGNSYGLMGGWEHAPRLLPA